MIRLFVALTLPERLRTRLAGLGGGVPGARWIEPANLHLTLRFIGETEEGALSDLDAELARIDAAGFDLVLDGVGQFGTGRKVHSLWAGVDRNEALLHLQAKVESAVVRAGFAPEPRKFQAHVTLARLRDPNPERVMRFLAGNNLFRSQPEAITSFTLYRSYRSRSGADYERLADYALSGPGQIDA